jgi:uracil-DNA glycosylase family 4
MRGNYVPGCGNREAKLLFVGEAPGQSEEYLQEPFVGPTGELLKEICREIGIEWGDIYATNVIKYRPPQNQLKRLGEIGVSIDDSINQLWDEINALKPNCIVAFGNLALKAIAGKGNGSSGIMKWRGSCMKTVGMDFKVVPTIHPAALLHSSGEELEDDWQGKKKGPLKYSYRHILKLDLLRAKAEAESSLYAPPERVIEIAKDSISLGRFLSLYSNRDTYPTVSVDIEVVKSVPFCIGLAFNSWHAISIPLIDVFSWQNLEGIHDHQLAEMWRMVAELLESDVQVIGQNFKFDRRQLARLCGIFIKNFHCDTSLLAHSLHPEFPKALEFTTSIYTKEPYYKEEGKEFDWKRDKITRFLTYNGRDACVTFEVFEEMRKDARELNVPGFPDWYENFVLKYTTSLHRFYYELEDVGFRINLERQKELVAHYGNLVKEAQDELNKLAGWEVNVNSKPQCATLVYTQLRFPQRKGTAEEVLVALMANTKKITPGMRRILELILLIRRLQMAKKKISAKPDYDGRMKCVYRIAGTETGRSSTGTMKPPMRPEDLGMPFHTMTKHGDIGTEVREMFIADEGYTIVETDMSQAEARIVASFANDFKLLKLFADKADVHKITAASIFNVNVSQVTKEMRFIGKIVRHAGNYDMGKHRLMELVNTEAKRQHIDINLSEWKAGKLLDAFHSFSPNIRGVFHQEIQNQLQNNNRILVNPFGRYRQFFDRWGRELWKEAYAHLPQSTVPDSLRRAGIRANGRFVGDGIDARFVVEAHDALVALVRTEHIDRYVTLIHEEIEKPIDFKNCTISRDPIIIPAETKIGMDYKNLKKYELPMAA